MDEEISIINNKTRSEKVRNFFVKNKKKLIITLTIIIILIFSFFILTDFQKKNKIKLANKFNVSSINFISGDKKNIENEMIEIIKAKDKTYSPLALYFLIDNNIVNSNEKINYLFDIIIEDIKLEKEIKNLVIYKKALFNSETESENNLINLLKPILNTNSIWKSHAFYLLGEYFYFKNEKNKAKEFFNKIIILENANQIVKLEAQKRLKRDFSE